MIKPMPIAGTIVDFFRNGHAVFRNQGRAERFFENHVSALGARG
jgi:hypothetical protein